MTSLDYYMDLLSIMIWEDYDYFKPYWPDVFINLTADDIEAIEFILQEEQEELKQAELKEVADKIPILSSLLIFSSLLRVKRIDYSARAGYFIFSISRTINFPALKGRHIVAYGVAVRHLIT